MKKWFNNQSVKKKILYGFGAVLVLLVIVSVMSFATISSSTTGFKEYRSSARTTNSSSNVLEDLMASRLNVVNFLRTSNERYADEFLMNVEEASKHVNKAYDLLEDEQKRQTVATVGKDLDEYKKGFNEVVQLVYERNKIFFDVIVPIGGELVNEDLRPLVKRGNVNASNALMHFLYARLNVQKYTEDSDEEKFTVAIKELDETIDFLERMGASSMVSKAQQYKRGSLEYAEITRKRDEIVSSTLEEIGPAIAERLTGMQNELEARQDELGPALQASNARGSTFVIIIALIAIAAGLGFALIISKVITEPIAKAYEMMTALGKGKLSNRMNLESKDEIGEMGRSMDRFADQLTGFSEGMNKVADGDLSVNVEPLSDEDELTPSFQKITTTLRDLDGEIGEMIQQSKEGNLSHRGNDSKFKGGFKELVGGFNDTLNEIVKPIRETKEVMSVMSTGDLTPRIKGSYKGEFAELKMNVNNLGDSLSRLIKEVSEAVQATATASSEISSSSEQMAAGAEEQNAQANEVASAVEEMTKTIFQNAGNASRAADSSKVSNENAQLGSVKVKENKESIERIISAAEITGQIIGSLAGKTDKIGEITQVIDDIADQTNLLALNAAIEAARAGEQGRGFAVVADEVRKLAERTTSATKEIAETIKAIQTEAKDADASMVEAGKSVNEGKRLTEELESVLAKILQSAESVALEIEQVASASEQQSTTSEEISKNIEAISTVTNETSTGIQQIARASEEMNRLTENLQHLTSKFKVALATEIGYTEEHSPTGYFVSGNGNGSNGYGRLLTV